MPFLGKQPTAGFATIVKDDLTPNGSTTAFTLSKQVAGANDIAVFLGNVRQEPTDAYTVSGTTLTMSEAPASGLNFYVLHIAGTLESSVVPAAGTTVPGSFGVSGDLTVDTNTLVVDASNNRMGVGTATPAQPLHVKGGAVQFENTQNTYLQVNTTDTHFYTAGAHPLRFGTNSTERARVDASGNLLVGTTNQLPAINNVEGIALSAGTYGGRFEVSRDNNEPVSINRKASDGSLVSFKKDGTTVGNIGSLNSRMFVGSGDVGLFFDSTNNMLTPYSTTANDTIDNHIDLGYSTRRFKNLFLSGGAYIGGTGSANYLDDYEEGTWTPVIRGSSSAGSYTTTTTYAKYRKVGNIVHISAYIGNITQSSAGSGYLQITGTPFQKPANQYFAGTVFVNQFNVASTAITFTLEPITYANSTSTFYVHIGHDNTSASNLLLSELVNGNSDLALSATYFTE